MTFKPATEVLEAIDEALEKDGGNSYRLALRKTIAAEEDIYRVEEQKPRHHLGPSALGKDCMREIWYKFRWCHFSTPSARMQRLFNRGHTEEARFKALLKITGVQFSTRRVEYTSDNGLYAMTSDGLMRRVPGLERETLVVPEFKTYNDKRFKQLVKNGVEKSDPYYYDQCQAYLQKSDAKLCLFLAVNKNDDALHAEWIEQQEAWQNTLEQKAKLIIKTDTPPPKISDDPVFFKCKMCDVKDVCHKNAQPLINCRTCAHWGSDDVGSFCTSWEASLVDESGCERHAYNPHLVPAEFDGGDGYTANYRVGDVALTNGPSGLPSQEFWPKLLEEMAKNE